MELILKIKSIVSFVKEEAGKVPGELEIKKEIIQACSSLEEKIEEIKFLEEKEIIAKETKGEVKALDVIIEKIKDSEENRALFMLLICHVADIKFLLSSEKEQERIMKEMEQ
jgi:prephenate dehydratase